MYHKKTYLVPTTKRSFERFERTARARRSERGCGWLSCTHDAGSLSMRGRTIQRHFGAPKSERYECREEWLNCQGLAELGGLREGLAVDSVFCVRSPKLIAWNAFQPGG